MYPFITTSAQAESLTVIKKIVFDYDKNQEINITHKCNFPLSQKFVQGDIGAQKATQKRLRLKRNIANLFFVAFFSAFYSSFQYKVCQWIGVMCNSNSSVLLYIIFQVSSIQKRLMFMDGFLYFDYHGNIKISLKSAMNSAGDKITTKKCQGY